MLRYIVSDAVSALRGLEPKSVQCVVTSPPYWGLRRYTELDEEIGVSSLDRYLEQMEDVFDHLRRVLADDGLVFLNVADTAVGSGGAGGDYNSKGKRAGRPKYRQGVAEDSCCGSSGDDTLPKGGWADVPHRLLHRLQSNGWRLRKEIVWYKGVPRPESISHVKRPLVYWEPVFMLAKEAKSYKYRPARLTTTEDLWQIKPTSVKGHQAPFPEELVENCMLPSTDEGDWVLDPFAGSGTTLLVANNHRRNAIGIDIDPRNVSIVQERLDDVHMEIRHDNSSIISSA